MVIHVVGARPQFIKLAPVLEAFRELSIPFKVLHTGQHYDYGMSELLFKNLELPGPEYNLGIGSASHAHQTGMMLTGIEEVLHNESPTLLLVYGDTNSTLAGALAASKLGIKVGHVEAGLRSFDRRMPEEINRVVADHLSDYHFCPTRRSVELLKAEGIAGMLTGDVMVDALQRFSNMEVKSPFEPPYILATIHRAENTDDHKRFHAIWEAFQRISKDIPVIFPVHPRTRDRFRGILQHPARGVKIIDPVGYLDMIAMLREAQCIITDSGGVQKEALLLKTPCVTVRETTEWPETVEAGGNRLVQAERDAIYAAVKIMLDTPVQANAQPFGDGSASQKIARFVKEVL